MSRTIPRAYVTAAWSKNPVEAVDQAKKYCSELVKAGYLPLCPVLAFSGVIAEDDPDGEKKRREMSQDLLKRARFLVVCGKNNGGNYKHKYLGYRQCAVEIYFCLREHSQEENKTREQKIFTSHRHSILFPACNYNRRIPLN